MIIGLSELEAWRTETVKIAGGDHRGLRINIRFDGHGNSVVRFIVTKDGEDTEYEKYNSAVIAYNLLRGA